MQKRVHPAFQGPVRLQENLFWGKIIRTQILQVNILETATHDKLPVSWTKLHITEYQV